MTNPETPVGEVVTASYRWNAAEFITAQRGHMRWYLRPAIVWILNIFLSVLALLGAFCLLILKAEGSMRWQLVLWIIGCLVLLFGRERLIAAWLKWHWKTSKSREGEVMYEFTANALSLHSSHSSGIAKWSAYIKITETRHGFLFYSQARLFYWVPFSAFDSESDIAQVRTFIRQSGVPFTSSPG